MPPIGRIKTAKRRREFIELFEKNGRRVKRIIEAIIRRKWGTQS
jgi:hypothetical protein